MEGTSTNVEDYSDDKTAVQETIQQSIPLRIATSNIKIKLECEDIKPFFKEEFLVEDVKDEKEANDNVLMDRTVESDVMSFTKREIPYDFNDSLNMKNETVSEKDIFVGSTFQNTESDLQNTFIKQKPSPGKDTMVKSEFVEEDKDNSSRSTCNRNPECDYNSLNMSEKGKQCKKESFPFSESTMKSELGYDIVDKDRNLACFRDIQGMYFEGYYKIVKCKKK